MSMTAMMAISDRGRCGGAWDKTRAADPAGGPQDLIPPPPIRSSKASGALAQTTDHPVRRLPLIASDTLKTLISAQTADTRTADAQKADVETAPPTTATGNADVHNMTNQEMLDYAKTHHLRDVELSFTLDYCPVDLSPAGQAAFHQTLMSDPTKHDFVKMFQDAADGARSRGDTQGSHYFDAMMKSLAAASTKDASDPKAKKV